MGQQARSLGATVSPLIDQAHRPPGRTTPSAQLRTPRISGQHRRPRPGRENTMKLRYVLLTALAACLFASGPAQAGGWHGQSLSAVTGHGAGVVNVTTTSGQIG